MTNPIDAFMALLSASPLVLALLLALAAILLAAFTVYVVHQLANRGGRD